MRIYRHAKSNSLIVVSDDAAIYGPCGTAEPLQGAIAEIQRLLNTQNPRRFLYDPDLTAMATEKPSQSCKKPNTQEPDPPLDGPPTPKNISPPTPKPL